ncbi:hypothetical protein V1T76_04425 [Roseibium sp. FZY0029]|uniref:hypothetical protein n=1 Tax=Roseibium sp. FZY0029 TaxID=3116647 RepID=UPI002EA23273|nr:hypothetical protein [Roseibium sp. FZY0029]
MNTTKKILSSLCAATLLSTALIGHAFADPDDTRYSLTGNKALTVRQSQIVNERALRAARTLPTQTQEKINHSTTADYPDQAFGDANGDTPISVRRAKADKTAPNGLPILPFLSDWNGQAAAGFPHK